VADVMMAVEDHFSTWSADSDDGGRIFRPSERYRQPFPVGRKTTGLDTAC